MKAKLLRDMQGRNPEYSVKAHKVARLKGKPYHVPNSILLPAGTVIDHPHAFYLVMNGDATPEDAECRIAAGNLSDEEIAKRAKRQQLLEDGRLVGALTGDTSYDRPRRPRRRGPVKAPAADKAADKDKTA